MENYSKDSFNTHRTLTVAGKTYHYFSLPALAQTLNNIDFSRLPFSLKILLENLLRHEDGQAVVSKDIQALAEWSPTVVSNEEIAYHPARVLMQDFTGVPAVVDLASMRDAMKKLGGNAENIKPQIPVDLVIDHSVQVDHFGAKLSFQQNVSEEMHRNLERYQFLKWGQKAFSNFQVVPPGTGICHQVNLEYLAKVAWSSTIGENLYVYPDTLVGTDSHTTMVNGLGVLGWGVGGIEAEAAMLGQGVSMLIPEVVGFKLTGKLLEGMTATDLVLTITQMLRKAGVVGKFVEFFGPGLAELSLADRATIANMAPEYGATCGFFPVDQNTLEYLTLTGRDEHTVQLVKAYCQAQGLWRESSAVDPAFSQVLELNLQNVVPCVAGPKRPQDRVNIGNIPEAFQQLLTENKKTLSEKPAVSLDHGSVVIAAITSCTNTSNPSVLIAAGLVAKKARERGLTRKPWVKTSLAPGSKVVTEYLLKTGLQTYLDELGFNLVGYGCTTCIGNSGPLDADVEKTITDKDLIVSAVLSGNRNFEGRVHPLVKANWLASPPLVVAFALAGTTTIDIQNAPIAQDAKGKPVFLKDLWPSQKEIQAEMNKITQEMFRSQYANVFAGDEVWQKIPVSAGQTYTWDLESTYVRLPPFFENLSLKEEAAPKITDARILALLGDSITTDHISPAGNIKEKSPAGKYLKEHGVSVADFNSYGARRGNHEVMMRGTFANIRIKNEMAPGTEGGVTKHIPSDEIMPIYDAAMRYINEKTPLVIIAGKEYGTGSSRDWAAKGTLLLGVKAVICESFERIHRSNLIGMGVLPLQFTHQTTRKSLQLTGIETVTISGLEQKIQPRMTVTATFQKPDKSIMTTELLVRIDTENEVQYYLNGGILPYVLRRMLK